MNKKLLKTLAVAAWLPLAASAQPTVDFILNSGIIEPHSLAYAGQRTLYITDSATHRVLALDTDNGLLTLFAGAYGISGTSNGPGFLARFSSPRGIIAARGGLIVADAANHALRFLTTTGSVSVVSTFAGTVGQPGLIDGPASAARFNSPVGLAVDAFGNIYVADSKNNAVRKIDINNNVTTLSAGFAEPNGVAVDENGKIFVADTRNNAIKVINPDNSITHLAGSAAKVAGTTDSYFAGEALFNAPTTLLWAGTTTGLIVSDTGNHTLRRVYYNEIVAQFFPELGGYSVELYGGTPRQPGFVDGLLAASKFNTPIGLARNNEGGLMVADLGNRAIRHIQTTPPLPRVKNPTIGYVTFVLDQATGKLLSQLNGFTNVVFNNDAIIAVMAESNTETFYTFGATPGLFQADTIPAPNSFNSMSAPPYADGVTADQVKPSILSPSPDITLKVIGTANNRRPSDLVQARIQFKVAAPSIVGDNPASFSVTTDTALASIWYTLDGSDPTNQPPSIEAVTSSISIVTNSPFVFRARGFRNNYKASEVVTKSFSPTKFEANRISFGFERGEASSDFVASPGQRFYAPVTLSTLPQAVMYSLQFNVLVTNLSTAPAVAPGAIGFESTLVEEIPTGSGKFRVIPPAMFHSSLLTPPSDPPPPEATFNRDGVTFTDLLITNPGLNLLGVGWLERITRTNLFNSTAQDLITFSQPHDTLFRKASGKVVLGAYSFIVPGSAAAGNVYEIKLGRASATSDGVGAPGSDVYIDMPTTGSLGAGAINAIKNVVVGQRKYIVGDVAPFRWLNAGDFGNTNILSDDVMQVFQSAVYGVNAPIPGSDFFDGMDSCCTELSAVPGANHFVASSMSLGGAMQNPLFDGSDTTINNLAFGDGVLNVADVYVTFRRALDPSLVWFQRFWTNGVLGAETVQNLFRGKPNLPAEEFSNAQLLADQGPSTEPPSISFGTPDLTVQSGQTLTVPVTARIRGRYAARVAMLNLEVEPLDGSPSLRNKIEFTPNPNLGQPTITDSRGTGNFSAAWLNRSVTGLRGETVIGTLQVRLPDTLPPGAAYRIRFAHASASPNGLATFPQQSRDGLLLASPREGSVFNDGIPDSWRLRFFGSTANLLSHAQADADGDGVPNWAEFKAGTNPVDARSNIRVKAHHGRPKDLPRGITLRWPTAEGKKYAIEAATNPTSREWVPVAPVISGTGFEMEFTPPDTGTTAQFFRVRLAE